MNEATFKRNVRLVKAVLWGVIFCMIATFALVARAVDPPDYVRFGSADFDTPIVSSNKIELIAARLEAAAAAANTNSLIVGRGAEGPESIISRGRWQIETFIPYMFVSEAARYIEEHGGTWTSETDFAIDFDRLVLTLCGVPVAPLVRIEENRVFVDPSMRPLEVYLDGQFVDGLLLAASRVDAGIELNDYAVVLGNAAKGTDYGATAVGHKAEATYHHATAIGHGAKAYQPGAVSINGIIGSVSNSYGSVCVGSEAIISNATKAVAVGYRARGYGHNAVALGSHTTASGKSSVAIGSEALATATGAVQIGKGQNATAGTLQFRSFRLLNEDGTIPAERLGSWGGQIDEAAIRRIVDERIAETVGAELDAIRQALDAIVGAP